MFAYGVTVEVVASTRDRHGDTTDTVTGVIVGCALAPAGSVEDTDQRAQVDDTVDLYMPPTEMVVTAHHKLLINGVEWRVDGTPQHWASPSSGLQSGSVVRLRRVTG